MESQGKVMEDESRKKVATLLIIFIFLNAKKRSWNHQTFFKSLFDVN